MRPHIRGPVLHVGLPWLILFGLLELTGWLLLHLALAVKRHPGTTTAATATWAAYRLWTTHPATAPATGALLAAATIWSTTHPETFDTYLGNHLRTHWRRNGYRHRWNRACTQAGFQQPTPQGPIPPQLVRVQSHGPRKDVLRARLDGRETVEDWQRQAHLIARALKVHTVRVRPYKHDQVELTAYRTDPLAQPIPPLCDWDANPCKPGKDPVSYLQAIPVGIREDGQTFTLPLNGKHILIGGETGSGKGSYLWAIITAIAPLIHDGHLRLWVIDPKGGTETALGRPLFHEWTYGNPTHPDAPWQTDIADLLDDAVLGLQQRQAAMRQPADGTDPVRLHTPTRDEPALVIVIDELASLTAYIDDPALRRRINNSLSYLLSQARAGAITLIAACQDVRKETIGMRDLFPTRIALRTAEPGQVDMLLGRGAYDRGAHAHRISPTTPGVAYVSIDGEPDPVRVRAPHITDQHITDTAARYAPTTRHLEAA
jgi:S-DNA-T family DNA segregation ATPase FtsK/SpoIIIE